MPRAVIGFSAAAAPSLELKRNKNASIPNLVGLGGAMIEVKSACGGLNLSRCLAVLYLAVDFTTQKNRRAR